MSAPFGSVGLAARIERADCRMLSDCADATTRRHPGADVFTLPVGGGVAAFVTEGSPFNKVAGLGFSGPLDEAELADVERAFARRGASVRVELSCLATPSVGALLTERGYALQGFENVLGRALSEDGLPAAPTAAEVTECPLEQLGTWLDVVVTGFATPDTQGVPSDESFPREVLERVMGDMAAADGFVRYLARRDGALAGGASMRVSDGLAQLCGAATLPEHRRRGVQTALLHARLRAARAAGCDLAVVTTQPGSKSQENVQRQGFELLYTRAVLVRNP